MPERASCRLLGKAIHLPETERAIVVARLGVKMPSFKVLLVLALWPPFVCVAQSVSTEPEVLEMRQKLCDEFSQAMAKGDIEVLVAHYSQDIVYSVTSPTLVGPILGREALRKYYEIVPKQISGYVSKVEKGQIRSDGTVWTQGIYSLFAKGPDGTLTQRWGRWMDILRRNGDQWEVVYQVNAGLPAKPNPDPTSR